MRPTGLRESQKAATRLALAYAVLTLATREGIEAVTIDAVAAEAGVSVRTFHNYFTSKEDALVYFTGELLDQIADGLRARPPDEPFATALRACITEIVTGSDDLDPAVLLTLLRLFDTEPTLTAHSTRVDLVGNLDAKVTEMLRSRDLDPTSLYPQLVFNVALCTARCAIEYWVAHPDSAGSARESLDAAFDQVEAGIAQPLS